MSGIGGKQEEPPISELRGVEDAGAVHSPTPALQRPSAQAHCRDEEHERERCSGGMDTIFEPRETEERHDRSAREDDADRETTEDVREPSPVQTSDTSLTEDVPRLETIREDHECVST